MIVAPTIVVLVTTSSRISQPSTIATSGFTYAYVATYAYVNPVVAIVLGWLILDELITPIMLAGAAIIVLSVALVVRIEGSRRP